MIEEINFETFLYISNEKYQVTVFDKKKCEDLYNEELRLNNKYNALDLDNLEKFLDENIYKIEKLINNFIKNIILIIENDKNLNVNISIKKKIYDNLTNQNYLEHNLIEVKDLYKENFQDQNIMHMNVVNYIFNGEKYSTFESNLLRENFCLEVNFISISNELAVKLNKTLEKYQIKVSRFMCGAYIKNFFDKGDKKISLMAYKIINGHNNNEVTLVPKNIENRGFFEKFFQLFS